VRGPIWESPRLRRCGGPLLEKREKGGTPRYFDLKQSRDLVILLVIGATRPGVQFTGRSPIFLTLGGGPPPHSILWGTSRLSPNSPSQLHRLAMRQNSF
jgi:hypothetical protein